MKNASRFVTSPMGLLRLEATARGLVAVRWAERTGSPDPPGDRAAERVLDAAAGWLAAYFAGRPPAALPPLDPAGTPFQRAVWTRLAEIPFGATVTYGELARALGRPGAARAVGQANGKNPVPILVPCHRVLAGGSRIGGYSAGLARKRWLLAHERISVCG